MLRSALHRRGLRFRKGYLVVAGDVRVRPDVVFTRRRVAAFLDGCFWHACAEHGTNPASNSDYWIPKLRRNVERDRLVEGALTAAGWTVVRVWEHELRLNLDASAGLVEAAVAAASEGLPLGAGSTPARILRSTTSIRVGFSYQARMEAPR